MSESKPSNKFTARRSKPLQHRSQERVRLILSTALALFKRDGFERVTTNDIARAAGIPIGSLYRYYPSKEAILGQLTELYATDLSAIFKDIGAHPMLAHLSWDEVLLIVADAWVNFGRLNANFPLLYVVRANPQLRVQNRSALDTFSRAFHDLLQRRCPLITRQQVAIYFQLMYASVEMGVNDTEYPAPQGVPLYYDAVSIIAADAFKHCLGHDHGNY